MSPAPDPAFAIYSALYHEGRKYEQNGEHAKALEIYLDILQRFCPRGTAYYERPAVLLEKNKRFRDAADICRMALDRAECGLFFYRPTEKAVKAEFSKRLQRLQRKIAKQNG